MSDRPSDEELRRIAGGSWASTARDLARELLITRSDRDYWRDYWRERADVAERLVDALDSGDANTIAEARREYEEMHEPEPLVPCGALDHRGQP